MKKIFLLAGIAAFSSVTAQQKDFFDIDKLIQKKQLEKKKTTGIEIPGFSFNNKFDVNNYFFSNKPDQTYTLTNGDKVIIFSLDNMPCVVPDMKQFQIMPNAGSELVTNNYNHHFNYNDYFFKKSMPGIIPNGSIPFKMIVDAGY